MDNNNLDLIREIAISFKNYENEKDVAYLEYAHNNFNSLLLPLEEEAQILNEAFLYCPDEYLRIIAKDDIVFFIENKENENFDYDLFFECDIFMKSSYLGDEKYKTYISYIIELFPKDNTLKIPLLFLQYMQDALFFEQKNMFSIITKITEKYDSWLAYGILAALYFEDENYENAIICIDKSNNLLKGSIEFYRSESVTVPVYGHFEQDLIISLSTNLSLEIEAHYFSEDYQSCIQLCKSILDGNDEDLIAILEFQCYFYQAFSLSGMKNYKEALKSIAKALEIDNEYFENNNDKCFENNEDEQSIKLKLFLLEKLKKYEEKIAFINELAKINLNMYINYSHQLDRLQSKQEISPEEEDEEIKQLLQPTLDKNVSKRLLGNISYSGNKFTHEKLMEAFIVSYIERNMPVFGRQFSIFKDKNAFGRQFRISNGVIDLLLVEKSTGNLYIIELKKDKGYNNPIEQMKMYQKYIKEKIAAENQEVFGIICLSECTDTLKSLVKREYGIELFSYDLLFHKQV